MTPSSARALLRIAQRDARRNKGRSLLILLTLMLPVAGLVAAVTLVHALAVPPATKATWVMGTADAVVQVNEDVDGGPASLAADLSAAVPAGSRTLPFATTVTRVAGPDGLLRQAGVSDLAYTDPLAIGMVRQVEGRAPQTPHEVSGTAALARAAHLGIGSRLLLRDVAAGRTTIVVGIADPPPQLDTHQVWVSAGALDGPAEVTTSALVTPPAGAAVTSWTGPHASTTVMTRYEVLHPANTQSALATSASTGLKVLVVGLALLEAVLMAGA